MAQRRKVLELLRTTLTASEPWCTSVTQQPLVSLSGWQHRRLSSAADGTLPPAFVFDIDGVLIRGKQVLDPARRALAKLYSPDGQNPKLPVCFLTNGGGVLESEKAKQLSGWLGVNIGADQVVLSHTPFKELVPQLGNLPVLIAGRHPQIEEVAKSYGFRKTVTTAQLAAAHPSAVPFAGSQSAVPATTYGSEAEPIEAVLVFSDPANWYVDLQLITDVISSGGVPGRPMPSPGSKPVQVYFSNPDLVFAAEFPTPRFAQGALAVALRALLNEVAECPVPKWKVYGKPNPEPYRLVTALLAEQARRLGLQAPSGNGGLPYGAVYMVGDNPATDVAGARNAGPPWVSILVRTGIFQGGNSSRHPADIVVDDVQQAVEAGLHRSRSEKWHSMR